MDSGLLVRVYDFCFSHKSNNLFTYIFKMCKCEYNKSEKKLYGKFVAGWVRMSFVSGVGFLEKLIIQV